MNITLTRSLIVILLPGAIALTPFIVAILLAHPEYLKTYTEYRVELWSIGAGLAIILGMFMEGVSSYLEVIWDESIGNTYAVEDNWYRYLSATYENEPVAYRYISTKVTTMYFELAMFWVTLMSSIGWPLAICMAKINNADSWATLAMVVGLILAAYFYWQAKSSHGVLCTARLKVNAINGK